MEALDTVQVLGLLVGVILPVLVGLVTTKVTSSGVKAVLLAALAAVTGLLTEVLNAANSGEVFQFQEAVVTWLGVFIVAVAVHFGFWKPTGVSGKAQRALVTSSAGSRKQE